jgi:DNA invertase Pin-like site-specific DNA recombinase
MNETFPLGANANDNDQVRTLAQVEEEIVRLKEARDEYVHRLTGGSISAFDDLEAEAADGELKVINARIAASEEEAEKLK